MKKTLFALLAVALAFGWACTVFADDDMAASGMCKYCGMNRHTFAHSRMFVEYDEGGPTGTCSLHCLAVDLVLNIDRFPKTIRVGDYGTKKLIDAEQAVWVIGGGKPGVMTKNAKWAFENRADAEAYVRANGGKLATFDEALSTAYGDISEDTKMIRDRRKMKRMQAGQKPTDNRH